MRDLPTASLSNLPACRPRHGAGVQVVIPVVIVDDHPIVRAEMRAVLDAASDVTMAGDGGTGAATMRPARDLGPDVLVLDINLSRQPGCIASGG